MLILTFVQRKRNAHRLIIARHAELWFVGFDALGSVYDEHVEVLGSSKKLGWLFVCSFHYRDFVFCQAVEGIDETVDFTLFGRGVGEWARFLCE